MSEYYGNSSLPPPRFLFDDDKPQCPPKPEFPPNVTIRDHPSTILMLWSALLGAGCMLVLMLVLLSF